MIPVASIREFAISVALATMVAAVLADKELSLGVGKALWGLFRETLLRSVGMPPRLGSSRAKTSGFSHYFHM